MAVCVMCGMRDPPPEPTCPGPDGAGPLLDHTAGDAEEACPGCGRLAEACAARPCRMRAGRGT